GLRSDASQMLFLPADGISQSLLTALHMPAEASEVRPAHLSDCLLALQLELLQRLPSLSGGQGTGQATTHIMVLQALYLLVQLFDTATRVVHQTQRVIGSRSGGPWLGITFDEGEWVVLAVGGCSWG